MNDSPVILWYTHTPFRQHLRESHSVYIPSLIQYPQFQCKGITHFATPTYGITRGLMVVIIFKLIIFCHYAFFHCNFLSIGKLIQFTISHNSVHKNLHVHAISTSSQSPPDFRKRYGSSRKCDDDNRKRML